MKSEDFEELVKSYYGDDYDAVFLGIGLGSTTPGPE